MKKILPLILVFLFTIQFHGQDVDRVTIEGSIQMPEEDEAQGISVFNLNTNRGTVTNDAGQFRLAVKVDDSIRVSAVQFQEFTVIVNKGVIESGQLNINVTEVINQLPEVVVSPYDLTGNVNVDITRLVVVQMPDTLNSVNVQSMYFASDADPNYYSPPRNTALEMHHRGMEHGLNFANLFKQLLITSRSDQVRRPTETLDADVRELYNDEFFREHLDIKRENITEFIYFADENGLDERMLREGHELELIDFLVEQSKKYKKQQARN